MDVRPRPAREPGLPRTWLDSDRRLARALGRPIRSFLDIEASGGLVLLAATVAALAWANSPWRGGYDQLFHTEVALSVGRWGPSETLAHWVNDGLMAVFFFVVGIEIKRELVTGELQDRRAAALPAIAALGGMVVPASIYAATNLGGPGAGGWGIPMATDIAFALGLVALLGRRVPPALKLFLLTLAIVDDIGAIAVIAVFYSGSLRWAWLVGALGVVALVLGLRRVRVLYHPLYVALGVALWLCVFESGVHATIAGVVMGLLTPARPFLPAVEAEAIVDELEERPGLEAEEVRSVAFRIRESVALTDRLEHALHPWTSYVIIPIFALANAGIELSGSAISGAARVTTGVVAGLVVGKVVGISGATWLAVRTGVGRLPEGVRFPQLVGAAALAGIGFTVSLFVAGLAFDDGAEVEAAKVGVLLASVLAAALGSALLVWTGRSRSRPADGAG